MQCDLVFHVSLLFRVCLCLGRVSPGKCYHLYNGLRASLLDNYQLPEIQRTPLEELCLQIKVSSQRLHLCVSLHTIFHSNAWLNFPLEINKISVDLAICEPHYTALVSAVGVYALKMLRNLLVGNPQRERESERERERESASHRCGFRKLDSFPPVTHSCSPTHTLSSSHTHRYKLFPIYLFGSNGA